MRTIEVDISRYVTNCTRHPISDKIRAYSPIIKSESFEAIHDVMWQNICLNLWFRLRDENNLILNKA